MFNHTPRSTAADNADHTPRRGRPSVALIVSSLALFTALGGGAYAASTIGSPQIKNNAVQGVDIKDGTIKSADIALGTRNSLRGKAGPAGPQGPAGLAGAKGDKGDQGMPGTAAAKGDKGDKGDPGDPGVSGLVRVTDTTVADSDSPKSITVVCPAGKRVVGTGFDISGGASGIAPNAIKSVAIDQVSVTAALTSVTFSGYEQDPTALNWTLRGMVLCASA